MKPIVTKQAAGCRLAVLLAAAVPLCGLSAAAQTLTLVWADEFDGSTINPTKWEHEVNGAGGGNNELQYYTDRAANSFVENGHLVIQALDETFTGPDGTREYTSARLRTQNRGDWTYGRFEIRARLPRGQGLWPAIWMLPSDWLYGGWPLSGEIDIMELVGHEPNVLHGTLVYGDAWPNQVYDGAAWTLPAGDFSENFHEFALEWEEDEMRWYVDDILYSTKTSWHTGSGDPFPAPFNARFHLLLNVAVGGGWPGSPDETTVFPQRMEVDYVRVYQRNDDLGSPTIIEGTGATRIEAEDYAVGGEGIGYHDSSPGNQGGMYRNDDVDIETTEDIRGGHNLGWVSAGEWLTYPVDVRSPGLYRPAIRTASPDGGACRLELDGAPLTGTIPVPATGDWQNWSTVNPNDLYLPAGMHTVRLVAETSGININWLAFVALPDDQDSDEDGMFDLWELRHFAHPTATLPHVDGDADGASNLHEFIADTDPTDALSRLQISLAASDHGVRIQTWPTSASRRYTLQARTLTNPGPWSDRVSNLTPTGPTLIIADGDPPRPGLQYRIRVRLPSTP